MKFKTYQHNKNRLSIIYDEGRLELTAVTDKIIRCVFTKKQEIERPSILVCGEDKYDTQCKVIEEEENLQFTTSQVMARIDKYSGRISWSDHITGEIYLKEAGKELTEIPVMKYTTGGEKLIIHQVKTVDGERNFIENLRPELIRQAYHAKLAFEWEEDEGIYGLGQGEEGIYNYRNHVQYLYQHNMRIPMPFLLSSKCYGIFCDCGSLMTFNDDERGSYLYMDTVNQLDYYFLSGKNFDELIGELRFLTGKAIMLPKWAFGYVQSKEQYYSADELVEVAAHYRRLQVPIDCIVQDWNSWEPGKWGEKLLDPKRYGNLKERIQELKKMHVHAMISMWPNMNTGGKNHTEFLEHNYLLNDYSTYDAFNEEARSIYWKQVEKELFSGGFEAWWCDSTEPFPGPDWGGEVMKEPWERYLLVGNEHKKYLDADKANLYALMHAKGIFENQRKTTEAIRVLNLTRSGYASGQRYGVVLWSGDTSATWKTMKKQIVEGLNMAMSGNPYWTLDIGGFFTVGDKWQNRGCGCNQDPTPKWFWHGDYNEGVQDKGYCELYVRWLQLGCFLPIFRSHGTDTPREIWNFGHSGEMFYDAIEKFIKLRYYFMPYIYSLAGDVWLNDGTIMRSLLFDFLEDKVARQITDEFMFGPSLLICPVTEPMYYETGSREIQKEKNRRCYLPKGSGWYDYWNNQYYEGGQWIIAEASIDRIPIFVKAGSILPVVEGLQYADQKPEEPVCLRVYTGVDCKFTLYEDEGNNYNFENGAYATTSITWKESEQKLEIGSKIGSYPGMNSKPVYHIQKITKNHDYNAS